MMNVSYLLFPITGIWVLIVSTNSKHLPSTHQVTGMSESRAFSSKDLDPCEGRQRKHVYIVIVDSLVCVGVIPTSVQISNSRSAFGFPQRWCKAATYMLWLELSGADAMIVQKSILAGGISPDVDCEYHVPFSMGSFRYDSMSNTSIVLKSSKRPLSFEVVIRFPS